MNNKDLVLRIHKFLDRYAMVSPNFETEESGDNPVQPTSVAILSLLTCADCISFGLGITNCDSTWDSGAYQPFDSKEGREEHDLLLIEIKKHMVKENKNNVDNWEDILFDFMADHPCTLPHQLFEWLELNYHTPKNKHC